MQFYQTRPNAIILHNTLPAMCIEKVVVRKSGEELYGKTYQSPIAPQRVVQKPNLNYERQDTTSSDARTSFDHSDKHGGTYRETCRGEIRLQNPRIAPFGCPRTRSHPQTSSPELDSPVRESPEHKSTTSRPTTKSCGQSVRRAVEGNDLQHGTHGVLRDLRDDSQHSMPQLYDIMAEK